jgi:hypothetical protein
MDFRQWLINERATFRLEMETDVPTFAIEVGPNGKVFKQGTEKDLKKLIQDALRHELTQLDPNGFENAKARFQWVVKDVQQEHSELVVTILKEYIPRGRSHKGWPQTSADPLIVKFQGGLTGLTAFHTPTNSLDHIPNDPSLGYRGLNWEEWQFIRKNGYVQSSGVQNFSHQQGLTLFSKKPDSAEVYVHSFASVQNSVTFTRPGIIIAVPKTLLKTPEELQGRISGHELAYVGKLPMDQVAHIWMAVPASSYNDKKATFTFEFKYVPAWDTTAFNRDPKTGIYKLDPTQYRIMGNFARPIAGIKFMQIK